tara:strand:+ start:4048 stop:4422 length:375 start_codon:yes stop_codon:yes gene_type:complete
MRKVISLLFFGVFLTGCYTNSLTMVGPATGVATGKMHHTAASTTVNHLVKKQTGKTPLEHVLSDGQMHTIEKQKAKLNPCEQNKKLCNILDKRISQMQKKLMGFNLQSRIEKKHLEFFSKAKSQ